jgi:site-specific recombinase XerD
VVRRACRRAGVAEIGAHRLRHTVACQMIASGVALSNIALVLRQRAASSTSLYARVDVEALRTLAPPWPGVQQW